MTSMTMKGLRWILNITLSLQYKNTNRRRLNTQKLYRNQVQNVKNNDKSNC